MRLDIEDFSSFEDIKAKSEKIKESEENLEEKLIHLEEYYQKKINDLEKEYRILLEQRSKESFGKGYEEAQKKLQETFDERLNKKLEEKEQEKIEDIRKREEELLRFQKEYEEKNREFLEKLKDLLIDNLEEILHYLYIDQTNRENIIDIIRKVLEDFKQYTPLVIIVSPNLYEKMENLFTNIEIKVNDQLEENDFVIEFHDFKIESKIKEKIQVVKDEIKREIKKLT